MSSNELIFESWRNFVNEVLPGAQLQNVRGTPSKKTPQPEPEADPTPINKKGTKTGFRGGDPQIFTGPNSVAQALMDLKLNKDFINNLLAALKIDFETAGFEILENKSREEIKLPKTLQSLNTYGKSLNPRQKKDVATIISNLLRIHGVKLRRSEGEW